MQSKLDGLSNLCKFALMSEPVIGKFDKSGKMDSTAHGLAAVKYFEAHLSQSSGLAMSGAAGNLGGTC